MGEKMCNTINQNTELYSVKVENNYLKAFASLLKNQNHYADHVKDSSPAVGDCTPKHSESNFQDILQETFMDPNSIWDRGKISNHARTTPEDIKCLRRLENTVINLESYLENHPNQEVSMTSHNARMPVDLASDSLSDVDLEKFETNGNVIESFQSGAMNDQAEVVSISEYHNVRDVLLSIRMRLESFVIQENPPKDKSNTSNLEEKINGLKKEIESYVTAINEKRENELRKFSQNMMNRWTVSGFQKAFLRKEKLRNNVYETLGSENYSSADNVSIPKSISDRIYTEASFTMRTRYSNGYDTDFDSVEYYSMLINEERSERLLNDAPLPRYYERERVSLIFRDPEDVIKQWQSYQMHTIHMKQKGLKPLNFKQKKIRPPKHEGFSWGFTLDSNQNHILQQKLEKERRERMMFRIFFYFLSFVFFVLVVSMVQSIFSFQKHGN